MKRDKNKAAVELGRLGGMARAKLPKEKLSEIGKIGALARKNKKKSTPSGKTGKKK